MPTEQVGYALLLHSSINEFDSHSGYQTASLVLTANVMIDLKKTKTKFNNKKHHAIALGIGFELSFDEYVQLLVEANITEQDIHQTKYNLARYNDEGPYKYGNCRFILQAENIAERKTSEKMRESSRKNSKKMIEIGNKPENLQKRKEGQERYWSILRERTAKKRELMHKSYTGPRNSQFGTCWVTNNQENKKIRKEDLEQWLNNGYRKGRVL